jgi:hypothetical protein
MNLPTNRWTLPKLAKFCVMSLRRSAEDAHHVGTALQIAREKHTKDREWLTWLETEIPVSRATAYRYIELANRLTLSDCRGQRLQDVYEMITESKRAEQEDHSLAIEREELNIPTEVQDRSSLGSSHAENIVDHATNSTKSDKDHEEEEDLSWVVPEDKGDDVYVEESARFSGVLTDFLKDHPTKFLSPARMQEFDSNLLAIEKQLRVVRDSLAKELQSRAA